MTCSTSPPSNPSAGSPRTSTSPSAAPSPAPSSARSSPPPTTRSGGHPPRPSSTTASTCRSGTSTPAPTSTRTPARSCRPGTRPSTPSVTRTSRGTWPGSAPGSTPRACSPDPRDASRCIGYLTKYLTKHLGDCHQAATDAQAAHAARLADALRYEPCSPTCANWLRYGIQPRNARAGLRPGACKGKAHRREYLGYAGRRVLVSRKWSGKTLADHRADRKAWLTGVLGLPATDPARYTWEPVKPGDPDHMPNGQRLLHVVADRIQWQTALELARRRAAEADLSATGRAA